MSIIRRNLSLILIALVASLFIGSLIWSAVFETLLPLWRAGQMAAFYANLLGIPLIFAGLALFLYALVVLLRDLFQSWRRAVAFMLLAFALAALGAYLVNYSP